ncbi:HupE/UreJ family protein [bacterium]|nr:MAG: HupE/UreJ family protein [bacterium]
MLFVACLAMSPANAHELQPGYLELSLESDETYLVMWKVPAARGKPMAISPVLPDNCTPQLPLVPAWDGRAYVARWRIECPGGLEGGRISIAGLEATATDVLVRFDFADGRNQARRLTPDEASFVVPVEPSQWEVIRTYLLLGQEHILSGFDHLLFVLALLILVEGRRRLVTTVTSFTVAHSLTLAAATLGLVDVAAAPLEAIIALSIVFVAVEIHQRRQGKSGLTARYPWVIAFTFGLLHGFGFAGALSELGLPRESIPLALLFFNVGVEIGQLMFIAAAIAVIGLATLLGRRMAWKLPVWSLRLPPYAIGSTAAYWVIQRVAGFL